MNPSTSQEEEIFYQALEIKDAAARDSFVSGACQDNADLRSAVDAMLADHALGSRLFQEVAAELSTDSALITNDAEEDADLGATEGPYQLVRRLGEGGGGVVYEALQESPVRRKVALKILKSGTDRWRVMNRFQAERQALELMEHPNIARVLDAGVTRSGCPYFVMEHVQGTKITKYCAERQLPIESKLHLMQQICSAVQHAHQKGIIHCDLKPSNILVTEVEGVPVPKVIDFGIAKATAGTPADWTQQGCPIGTPAYMSPEQLNGSRDIDTRSDIYSLGVVMYELITGQLPFESDEAPETVTAELLRQSLNEPPTSPTVRARRTGVVKTPWNDDLDWIVLTALAMDREKRYATVRGLGQDIARYLSHEPILARPPSRLYQFRKLVRRNRLASGAIAASVIVLLAGFITSTYLYLKADAAEKKQAELRAEAEERAYVSKAAILLMQNKTAEADAEVQRMGGMLTQPSVEATNVFHKLATWNALRGNWKAASQRLLALSRVNRFDDTDMTDNASRDLLPIAPTLVEAGDLKSLEEFEDLLLNRMGQTNSPVAAEQILKISLLVPPSKSILDRLKPVAAVAQKSVASRDASRMNWLQVWRCFAVGLWHYRTGDYDESVRLLSKAMSVPRNDKVINACCLAVRSMALRKLGRTEEAEADFRTAKTAIDNKFASPLEMDNEGLWHDWLTARVLLREATPK